MSRPAPRRPPPRRRPAVLVAVAVVVAAAAWLLLRPRPQVPPAPPSAAAAVAPSGPAAAEATPAADPRPRLLAARARLACGDVEGEAVFVAPDRAVASVACAGGDGQLRLADGRELLARVLPGAPPGTSVLAVPGAAASFVDAGAATALGDGAALLVGLEGGGPEVVGEATARGLVSFSGLPMLRAEEAAGPLAGPVVDAEGRLVGVAPSVPPDPDRPWLAVPVEAFAPALGRDVPPAWAAASERAADEERRAQGELWNGLLQATTLVDASAGDGGLRLLVARASAGRPAEETVRLTVKPEARDCLLAGRITAWQPAARAAGAAGASPRVARIARVAPPPGGATLWIGTGHGKVDCNLSGVPGDAVVSIPGADALPPVPFPREALREALERRAQEETVAAEAQATARADEAYQSAEDDAAFEASWREAFREANGRVTRARQRRLAIEAERNAARENMQYVLEQQLSNDLDAAALEEKQAEEALDDLDRTASRAAVPRAWRRE